MTNPYATPTTASDSAQLTVPDGESAAHRILRIVGIGGAVLSCFGAFLSSVKYYRQDNAAWTVTAFVSGCMMLFVLVQLIRKSTRYSANHPMQPSGEVGRFEVDDQPSPPADR
jgi:hypothetical protein